MAKIHFHIDKARVEDQLTVDQFLGLQEGDMRIILEVLCYLVQDENGQYLDLEEARPLVGKMKMSQFSEVVQRLTKEIESSMVPPQNSVEFSMPMNSAQPPHPSGS